MSDLDPADADDLPASLDDLQDDSSADRQSGEVSTTLIAVLGVAIGIAVAAGVLWFSSGGTDDASSATAPPTVSAPGEADANDPAIESEFNPVDLVVAYGRSRTEDHALDGELQRPGQSAIPIRRAILGDRGIDEGGGTAAVTEAGETRQCELIDDQWLCAPPLPAVTADIDTQGFATLLLTEEPPYSIFAVQSDPPAALAGIAAFGPSTCWSMVSQGRRDRARFGAETTLCFHDELGALIGRVTETSAGDDVFIATDLRGEVTVADVEPSR